MPFVKERESLVERLRAAKGRAPAVDVVDFETHAIGLRPDYPPEPVGVAIFEYGRIPAYLAWGHPTENNCSKHDAAERLRGIWRGGRPVVFHNAKFDLDVANTSFDLPLVPTRGFLDTELLAFLCDPHAEFLALKPLAERLLGMESDERDELKDWIFAHVPECKGKPRKTWRGWGAFISRAPGSLVGRYAIGDVVRTKRLLELLHPYAWSEMRPAVEREHALVPLLIQMERTGTPVDLDGLRRDVVSWELWMNGADDWLRRRLNARALDLDSGEDLADALERAKLVGRWLVTPTGARSTSKESIEAAVTDPAVVAALRYRGRLATCLRTFGRPWLETAERTGGFIHFSWNQVRSTDERGKSRGARTGRMSSNPNAQNMPNEPPAIDTHASLAAVSGALPHVRRYIKAPRGMRLIGADASQQELRILAHYENGRLLKAYLENPKLDVHEFARQLVNKMLGRSFERKPIKNLGFSIIYGAGVKKTAEMMGVDFETGKMIKDAYLTVLPDLARLSRELIQRGQMDEPITTWGGRVYRVEPAKEMPDGRRWDFSYKMLNVLIQGSAADHTKQAVVNWFAMKNGSSNQQQLLLTVHDEFLGITPTGELRPAMARIKAAMESVEFSLPMLSEGKIGVCWSEMKPYRVRPE